MPVSIICQQPLLGGPWQPCLTMAIVTITDNHHDKDKGSHFSLGSLSVPLLGWSPLSCCLLLGPTRHGDLHLYSSLTRGLRRGPPAPVPASVLSGPTGRRVSRGGQARSPRGGAERGVSAGGRQRRGTPSEGKTKRRKGVGGGAGAPEAAPGAAEPMGGRLFFRPKPSKVVPS